ncbi:hypothetical protein PVK06_020409 [Gossypium arboreum]|uniref:Uncharacterized protein n=1 Tax=Gossypium arboreum TaxID=29729 RepID=A0ABR0PM98_GOSAR|nr:hypothetical protein PVK06_020409 [Gossypium arboreum]
MRSGVRATVCAKDQFCCSHGAELEFDRNSPSSGLNRSSGGPLLMCGQGDVQQSLPTLGSGNSEIGTEALAELVRKVVEEVLETKVKEIRETLQAGCLECKKRKDSSSQKTESRSVKHVKTRPNFSTCKNCNGHALDVGLRSIELRIANLILFKCVLRVVCVLDKCSFTLVIGCSESY